MCNVTAHNLLVIGDAVMRLSVTKISITHLLLVIGNGVMRISKNVQCHLLAVCHRKRHDETIFHKNVQCCLLPIGHRKICDETAFHKMCNVTHTLLVMGEGVVRLPFPKCDVSLTPCWS